MTTEVIPYRDVIDDVVARFPELTTCGFGVYDNGRCVSSRQRPILFRRERAEMYGEEARQEFMNASQFLARLNPIVHPNPRIGSSYHLKHVAERWIHAMAPAPQDVNRYVSNGMFIAAAVAMGFTVRRCASDSPNAWVGIGARSLEAVERTVRQKWLSATTEGRGSVSLTFSKASRGGGGGCIDGSA